MTFQYFTMSGKSDYVHDVISVTKVGIHTYEFTQHGKQGKLRVVEVIRLQLDTQCSCHHQ